MPRNFDMSLRTQGCPLLDLPYEPSNFRLFARMPFGQALWHFLKRPENVLRMQVATYLNRPAIEPLSPVLLAEFGSELAEHRIKQMIGHMVGQIMTAAGYELDASGLRITRPGLFSSGARYRPVAGTDGKAVRMTPEERQDWIRKNSGDPFNRWLDAQVRGPDGTLDEEKLQTLAEQYRLDEGPITPADNYRRLNIGVLLREIIPR